MTNKQYFTEKEVYELVLDYLENELQYGNLLSRISDIIEETKQKILSVIHVSKGKNSLDNIYYYYDSSENAHMVEIIYSDEQFNSLECYGLTYTNDDIVNDKIIALFHNLLVDELKELKNEFDY